MYHMRESPHFSGEKLVERRSALLEGPIFQSTLELEKNETILTDMITIVRIALNVAKERKCRKPRFNYVSPRHFVVVSLGNLGL